MVSCELLEGARQLAQERGLPTEQVTCPTENICEGSFCIYLRDDDDMDDPVEVEKFYNRLEKHFQLQGVIYQNERITNNKRTG